MLAAGALAAGLGTGAVLLWPDPPVQVHGLADRALLGRAALSSAPIRLVPRAGVDLTRITASLGGTPVRLVQDGAALLVRPERMPPDGDLPLVVTVPGGGLLGRDAVVRQSVTVDTSPPVLRLSEPARTASSLREPFVLSGAVEGATEVQADGRPVPVRDGRFELRFDRPPASVSLRATDAAGNRTDESVRVGVRHPGMRAVHMTALAWTAKSLREPVLAQLRAGLIDTVELDVKDEDGAVGYDSGVPLARESGAAKGYYDAREAVAEIHRLGGRVVGRIVAFRDPTLGKHFWTTGARDRLVQTPDGSPYSGHYGAYSFVNPVAPQVRQYNIDLAVEAARLGFDDLLYDYVRRPDGKLSQLRFPGLRGTPEEVIAGFVADSRTAVRAEGAYLGVSVYGIAATRPTEIAQDIPAMAKGADFISPMVYPSHWARGEYKVANPNAAPYDIVVRSLADFARIVAGTDTTIIPWLQDFSLGVRYGPAEVAAQIRAAKDNRMPSFLLWNAGSRYTWSALKHP